MSSHETPARCAVVSAAIPLLLRAAGLPTIRCTPNAILPTDPES